MLEKYMIDKSNIVPIYYQIAQNIKDAILSGELTAGTMIPSERELCDKYAVSRMTVRQAIEQLVNEELLTKQKGKGTFVSVPKVHQPLTSLTSFTMDMIGRGMVPTSRILTCQCTEASLKIAQKLDIPEGTKVISLVRLRLANEVPHAFESSYLLYDKAHQILNVDMRENSLYETLKNVCGLQPTSAKEFIEASPCPAVIAKELQIKIGEFVFKVERITFDENKQPIEYVDSRYRIDKFKFMVELRL